jgi:hypothetical protein
MDIDADADTGSHRQTQTDGQTGADKQTPAN